MEQVVDKVKSLVHDNSHEVYSLSAQMIQLKVIQGAVARLLEHIEDIVQKGRHEDRGGLAALTILEFMDILRLIDMGFYPLHTTMQETVNKLEGISSELFDIIVSPDGGKPSINSLLGWNYQAMEGNIKTFVKEFGREPENFEEVATYITEVVKRLNVKEPEQNKKADALTSTSENITN
ncbi:hypothetical protein [Lysinibacillus sp. NPDC047702]|uniref:hypothetical protein n=1 Tax=unclassified Lysinibacillus TaxID=2636778 RepID=UPI003D0508A2